MLATLNTLLARLKRFELTWGRIRFAPEERQWHALTTLSTRTGTAKGIERVVEDRTGPQSAGDAGDRKRRCEPLSFKIGADFDPLPRDEVRTDLTSPLGSG